MKEEWNRETKAAYGLTAEQLAEVDAQLEEIAASRALTAGPSHARVPLADLMGGHPRRDLHPLRWIVYKCCAREAQDALPCQ